MERKQLHPLFNDVEFAKALDIPEERVNELAKMSNDWYLENDEPAEIDLANFVIKSFKKNNLTHNEQIFMSFIFGFIVSEEVIPIYESELIDLRSLKKKKP